MGRTFQFFCTQCQYRALISGGADSGLNCEVQTIRCRECRELIDVFTRVRRAAGPGKVPRKFPAFTRPEIPPVILRDSRLNGEPDGTRDFAWQELRLACPVSASHLVEAWKHPGRCPRCHAFMEQEGLPFRIWE